MDDKTTKLINDIYDAFKSLTKLEKHNQFKNLMISLFNDFNEHLLDDDKTGKVLINILHVIFALRLECLNETIFDDLIDELFGDVYKYDDFKEQTLKIASNDDYLKTFASNLTEINNSSKIKILKILVCIITYDNESTIITKASYLGFAYSIIK